MPTLDVHRIDQKAADLQRASAVLKEEFFGLDEIIDQIISSINAWYTFPELIQRPVIVNLWGLTGVGKTRLVRRLSQLLEFSNRFVEIQMDGITSSTESRASTVANVLSDSSIEDGQPGILLLDEIQRYRTINELKQDVKVERFQDVWMLLSDGQFASDSAVFQRLESTLSWALYQEDSRIDAPKDDTNKTKPKERKYHLWPMEALQFKKLLKLQETVEEVMSMNPNTLLNLVSHARQNQLAGQRDYTKLLIFISGNLDEAFGPDGTEDDSDTDADVFHARTKLITVHNIKHALSKRFKAEQISRFGNNHIIYPSLSRKTYEQLIHATCESYLTRMRDVTEIAFTLTPESEQIIYNNAVYPMQGTRPVFSSVHKIFSNGLVQMAFWAIKQRHRRVQLRIDEERSMLIGTAGQYTHEVKVSLDIDSLRQKASQEFKTLVAVHEAGHALVHALLRRQAPDEIKVNATSYAGGYIVPAFEPIHHIHNRTEVLDRIAMLLSGRAAEALVFGPSNITVGAENDLSKATEITSAYVRQQGLDGLLGVEITENPGYSPKGLLPDRQHNTTIDNLLKEQLARSTQLLTENKPLFVRLVDRLLLGDTLSSQQFRELLPELSFQAQELYQDSWKQFKG